MKKQFNKIFIIVFWLIIIAVIVIAVSSYFGDSVNRNKLFNSTSERTLVKGTIDNAFIFISFQDNVDKKTAQDILAEYSKHNQMTFDVFQDRSDHIYLKPKSDNIKNDIALLSKNIRYISLIEETAYPDFNINSSEKNISISIDGVSLNDAESQIRTLGFEIIKADQIPVYATVNTDTGNKQKLLNLLKQDHRFSDVHFDYPV